MVLEKISRALTRRTSTYLAAVVASTFFVERAIFGGGDYIFESYNKGKLWPDIDPSKKKEE